MLFLPLLPRPNVDPENNLFPRCSALLSSVAANVPESSKRVESGFDGPQLDSDVIRFQVVHGW